MKSLVVWGMLMILAGTTCAQQRPVRQASPAATLKWIVLPRDDRGSGVRLYEVNGHRYYPLDAVDGFPEQGLASWYGAAFHGRPTASGEIYDMHKKTAAHKTLPLGTYVRVVNLMNGTETVVRVNDRGPFVKGRIIDLSYAAAREIDLIEPGILRVRVVPLGKEIKRWSEGGREKVLVALPDPLRGVFSVQVAAFKNRSTAVQLARRLRQAFREVSVSRYEDPKQGPLYRVRVSVSQSLREAAAVEQRLKEMGYEDAFTVSL